MRAVRGTKSVTDIARESGIPRTTVRGFYEREDRQEFAGSPEPSRITGLDVPVRPLAVKVPAPVRLEDVSSGPTITALVYGDTHFPFGDQAALNIVGQIAQLLRPSYICHIGDLLDCYALSQYDKDPRRKTTLQDEIDMARQHLVQMRMQSPGSAFVLFEGNHEDRLRRIVWNLPGASSALTQLEVFQRGMTWPKLLGLDELGVQFVPYDSKQAKYPLLPKWILKHGTLVRKNSAYTARGEWEKYGRSGASGHTHRLGVYFHSDHNGSHCWVETGCTCTLEPEYTPDPNWQQGCLVLTFEPQTGAFQAEPVYIHNGLAVWRGNVLQG